MLNETEVLKAFEDKAFAEKVFSLVTVEDVQKAFKEDKNLELSLEDIEELRQVILQSVEKLEKGEVTEKELVNIAGGMRLENLLSRLLFPGRPFKGPPVGAEPAHGITPRDVQEARSSLRHTIPNERRQYRRSGDNQVPEEFDRRFN